MGIKDLQYPEFPTTFLNGRWVPARPLNYTKNICLFGSGLRTPGKFFNAELRLLLGQMNNNQLAKHRS